MENVVITGMGCVSSLGNSPELLWQNLLQGKSGIAPIQRFDASAYTSRMASEIREFDASEIYSTRDQSRFSRCIQYAVYSAFQALKMAGKRSDKKGGFYAYTAARMADLSGKGNADSLYRVAEEKSIKANKPYNTATILYYRSLLKSTPKKEAAELKARCKNAFELMGLPNNAKRCGE